MALSSHVRPVSDGAPHPVITRLVAAGKLDRHMEEGANTVPAFLRYLPDRAEQAAVLRRRLDFLETPASFSGRAGCEWRGRRAGRSASGCARPSTCSLRRAGPARSPATAR